MGHYCRHCGRIRANERFSGRGHRAHICKDCSRRPKEEIQSADQMRELEAFLHHQSHISKNNLKRLEVLARSPIPEVARAAQVMTEVGKLYPYKRRRFKRMARENRDLMRQLAEIGFIEAFAERTEDDLDQPEEEFSADVIFSTDTEPWGLEEENPADDDPHTPFDDDEIPEDDIPF